MRILIAALLVCITAASASDQAPTEGALVRGAKRPRVVESLIELPVLRDTRDDSQVPWGLIRESVRELADSRAQSDAVYDAYTPVWGEELEGVPQQGNCASRIFWLRGRPVVYFCLENMW